jgi:predicted N-acetyltransferase YhbS
MREGCAAIATLSFSAWDGERLIGSLQCWPVALVTADGARVRLVMVGPVAVEPALQRGGVGRALMDAAIAAAEREPAAGGAEGALMMIGDPEYYGRFWGFVADATGGWQVPGPVERHRLLARGVRGEGVPSRPGKIVPDADRQAPA